MQQLVLWILNTKYKINQYLSQVQARAPLFKKHNLQTVSNI
jgi:hypothetical protein